jgi:hypothetical protein
VSNAGVAVKELTKSVIRFRGTEEIQLPVKRKRPVVSNADPGFGLVVKLTNIRLFGLAAAGPDARSQRLMICDRCHNVEEIVVTLMEVIQLYRTWALCGTCVSELPKGFLVA